MSQRTVLVTGCSDGSLGAAMAKAYHNRGFRVFAALRNTAKAGSLRDMNGIDIVELDVTSEDSVSRCAKFVESVTGGSLEVLVNNAGIGGAMPLLDASIEHSKRVYDTNVWGVLRVAQAFAPMLIKAQGVMCNISSVNCELVFSWMGIYSSSKAATTSISETLRIEMAPLGVRVVTVLLGGVSTNGNDPAHKSDLKLPENSYYERIWSTINRYARALVFAGQTQDLNEAAKRVVDDVLRGGSIFIRRGNGSTMSWIGNTFLPHGLFVNMINKDSGLSELGKQLEAIRKV
ncbi:hypothetical protein G7046_g201 [Stylonectria norvegica]|nr:hypothetical protein G7046_g201 [Stylonectria norvegica]